LGRAIEAAEEEMEAALKRTTEVHRSQIRQKDVSYKWDGGRVIIHGKTLLIP
jgi:hypothetical protein